MRKDSRIISAGCSVGNQGGAAVVILFDEGCNRVNLTPDAARAVAAQLVDWASVADGWQGRSPETIAQDWLDLMDDPQQACPAPDTTTTPEQETENDRQDRT